jgi:hypothetical protein
VPDVHKIATPRSLVAGFRRLSWPERRLLTGAVVLLAGIRVAVSIAGVRTVHRLLGMTIPRLAADPVAAERVLAISTIVDRASRHTVANTCLHRSLALWWLLGRRGIECRLQLGERKQRDRFEAHAWVEYAGVIVNDPGAGGGSAPMAWMPLEHHS